MGASGRSRYMGDDDRPDFVGVAAANLRRPQQGVVAWHRGPRGSAAEPDGDVAGLVDIVSVDRSSAGNSDNGGCPDQQRHQHDDNAERAGQSDRRRHRAETARQPAG